MSDKHIAFNEYFTGLCVGDTAVRKQLQVHRKCADRGGLSIQYNYIQLRTP